MDRMGNDSPGFRCFYFHRLPGPSWFISGDYYAGSPQLKSSPGVSEELKSLDVARGEVGVREMRHSHLAVLKTNMSSVEDQPASLLVGTACVLLSSEADSGEAEDFPPLGRGTGVGVFSFRNRAPGVLHGGQVLRSLVTVTLESHSP